MTSPKQPAIKTGPIPDRYLFQGESLTVSQIAARLKVCPATLHNRLRCGETPEKAFTGVRSVKSNVFAKYMVDGERLFVREWAARCGVSPSTIRDRLSSGKWDIKAALTTPRVPRGKSQHDMRPSKPVKLRLPPRIHTIPGGDEQTSKEVPGTGVGMHATEGLDYVIPTENENQPLGTTP